MNFFIDFEASDRSEEIISIGCVADNGKTYSAYVKPSNLDDITPFIQKLTGITPELVLEIGKTADLAFLELKQFVYENNDGEDLQFYCYGNTDRKFIQHTASKTMTDFEAKIFAGYLSGNLIDYSKIAITYTLSKSISLRKLLILVRDGENVVQRHDALEDAQMLKECFEGIDHIVLPRREEEEEEKDIPSATVQSIDLNSGLSPEDKAYLKKVRSLWSNMSVPDIVGDCSKEQAKIIITNIHSGQEKYFSSYYVAATYFNLKHMKNLSSTKVSALNKTIKGMAKQPKNFCGFRCKSC